MADLSCPHCSALVKIRMHGTTGWPRAVCKEQAVRHPEVHYILFILTVVSEPHDMSGDETLREGPV